MQPEESFLSFQDIYEALKEGKSFLASMPIEEVEKVLAYLNVLKSREKKIYTELGLDWNFDKVIRYSVASDPVEVPALIKFYTEVLKPRRKIAGFVILEEQKKASDET